MGTCWECVYHEAYIDEDEDGNLYDDGCICLNEKVDSSLVTDYHATNCPVYEDKENLTGCPYFEAKGTESKAGG